MVKEAELNVYHLISPNKIFIGTRIVIINCLASQAMQVFAVARSLGMLNKGWSWIAADAIASQVWECLDRLAIPIINYN